MTKKSMADLAENAVINPTTMRSKVGMSELLVEHAVAQSCPDTTDSKYLVNFVCYELPPKVYINPNLLRKIKTGEINL